MAGFRRKSKNARFSTIRIYPKKKPVTFKELIDSMKNGHNWEEAVNLAMTKYGVSEKRVVKVDITVLK